MGIWMRNRISFVESLACKSLKKFPMNLGKMDITRFGSFRVRGVYTGVNVKCSTTCYFGTAGRGSMFSSPSPRRSTASYSCRSRRDTNRSTNDRSADQIRTQLRMCALKRKGQVSTSIFNSWTTALSLHGRSEANCRVRGMGAAQSRAA